MLLSLLNGIRPMQSKLLPKVTSYIHKPHTGAFLTFVLCSTAVAEDGDSSDSSGTGSNEESSSASAAEEAEPVPKRLTRKQVRHNRWASAPTSSSQHPAPSP